MSQVDRLANIEHSAEDGALLRELMRVVEDAFDQAKTLGQCENEVELILARHQPQGAVDALEDFIAEVAAPTGRLRLLEHPEGARLFDIVKRGRASLAALRGQ